jgi:branched-chain amino acid transport system permease protein
MPLITAIGASFFWQYYFRGLFGSQVKPFPDVAALNGTVPFLDTQVLKTHVLVVVVTVVALIALNFFITRTKAGLAIRAVAENKDVAALMGINVDRTISLTFATGATMAGIAGLLYALVYHQVSRPLRLLCSGASATFRAQPWEACFLACSNPSAPACSCKASVSRPSIS